MVTLKEKERETIDVTRAWLPSCLLAACLPGCLPACPLYSFGRERDEDRLRHKSWAQEEEQWILFSFLLSLTPILLLVEQDMFQERKRRRKRTMIMMATTTSTTKKIKDKSIVSRDKGNKAFLHLSFILSCTHAVTVGVL